MTEWSRFADVLRSHGFTYESPGPRNFGHSFFGSVAPTQFGLVAIDLFFFDSYLTAFPKAFLRSSESPPQRFRYPHIDEKDQLCYEDGTKVFNRHDPESMVSFILDQIKSTLEIPEADWDAEIFREFKAYWRAAGDEEYFSELGGINGAALAYQLEEGWVGKYLVGQTAPLFNSFASRVKRNRLMPFCIVPIRKLPGIRAVSWPPKTLLDLQAWMGQIPKVRDRFQKAFRESVSAGSASFGVLLNCQEPSVQIGARFVFSESEARTLRLLARDPMLFWDHARKLNPPCTRVLATPLDFARIFSRNAAAKPFLQERRLVLAGCGTLGGNLAPILTRSGAGIGKDGLIELVDPDKYTFENYPRHRMGSHAVGLYKAFELKKELERESPYVAISAFAEPVQSLRLLAAADVVLDGTGDEATMHWLSRELIIQAKGRGRKVPLLSLWIHGAGDAICAFWQAPSGGCHECLRRLAVAKALYPPVSGSHVIDSCQSVYTPYSIDVSLQCCAQASSALRMGLASEKTNSFLLMQIYSNGLEGVRLPGACVCTDIPPDPDCPACGMNFSQG